MFENPRRGRQARNFATNAPKILDLKSSSEQISSRKLPLDAPDPRDLYGDAMLVPTLMGTNMRRTETNENICYRVLVQKLEFIPRGTNKH